MQLILINEKLGITIMNAQSVIIQNAVEGLCRIVASTMNTSYFLTGDITQEEARCIYDDINAKVHYACINSYDHVVYTI